MKTDWNFAFSFILIISVIFVVVTFAWSHIRMIWWHMFAFEHLPPVSTVVITCISFLLCERFSFINEKTTPSSENWRARREYKLMYSKGNRLTNTQSIENNVEAASLYFFYKWIGGEKDILERLNCADHY
jgi:hypothetical protein